jgi:RND family efflux transporter MFP subunit
MKKAKKVNLLVCIALISAILLSGCGGRTSISSQSVYESQKSDKPVFIMAGKVDAVERADVGTKVSAKITEIKVDVGSVVKEGDLLARFDMKELPAQANQASAALQVADVNLDNAQLTFDRIQQLYQSGAASKQEYDSAEAKLNTASAQVAQARAGLDAVNAQLSNGEIVAPVSGIISAKNVNEGEMAIAGSKLFSIVNPDSIYINAYLPARLSEEVKVGQKVTVSISEIPDKLLDGEVTTVDPVVDAQNKNILVKVKLLEDDPALKVGMFAEIALKK